MNPTGMIFAALDCDADAIEAWNRWYDLEHLPPNAALEGVVLGRRYVAPPALHAARIAAPGSPFADGRSTFLTTYVLTGDPAAAFQGMVELREKLVAAGRMTFPDDKKAVRDGDYFTTVSAVADPAVRADVADIPFLGHTGLVVVLRRGGDEVRNWYRARAEQLVTLDGVHGVWSLASGNRPGLELDVVFVEGDAAELAPALRAAAPHHADVELVVDAPFEPIVPLRYPWADGIRASELPPTVA